MSAQARSMFGAASVILVVAAALVAIWWAIGFVRADARVLDARTLAAQNQVREAADELRAALGFRDEHEYRHDAGFAFANAGLEYQAGDADENFARAESLFDFIETFPDLPAARDWARLLTAGEDAGILSDGHERAADVYLRALQIDDVNPLLVEETAAALAKVERWEQVEQITAEFISDVYAQDAEIWGWLALARAHLGESAAAREAAEKALSLNLQESRALEAIELLDPAAETKSE